MPHPNPSYVSRRIEADRHHLIPSRLSLSLFPILPELESHPYLTRPRLQWSRSLRIHQPTAASLHFCLDYAFGARGGCSLAWGMMCAAISEYVDSPILP